MEQYFTIGQVAKVLRVSISTLKRWLRLSDVDVEENRNHNGWRLFSKQDIEKLSEYKKSVRRNGRRFKETTLIPIQK